MLEICECEKIDSSHPLFVSKSIKTEPVLGEECDICKKPKVIGWCNNPSNDEFIVSEMGDNKINDA